MRTLFVVGLVSLLGSACTHTEAPAIEAPSSVEVGRLVRQGHAPLGAPAHASMLTLELELSTGTKLISQPSVMTLPNTDAIVRQGFRVGQGDASQDATLDLTLRPVATPGKRCTVQASSRVSTTGTAPAAATTEKQVRVPMGKWIDVVDAAPIQVRMRCTQSQPAPTLARAH